jgi:hypothetical protein
MLHGGGVTSLWLSDTPCKGCGDGVVRLQGNGLSILGPGVSTQVKNNSVIKMFQDLRMGANSTSYIS